jgi:3-oxoacyl-[acyl-carrier protein] reductase
VFLQTGIADKDDSWKIQIKDIWQLVVDVLKLDLRSLTSKIEVRPDRPK